MLHYEGYLTEEKLNSALRAIFPDTEILKQISCPECKRWKFDYAIPSLKMFVEFDGDKHFYASDVIYRDHQKDALAIKHGWKVIRIPYFIQLNSARIVEQMFGVTGVKCDVEYKSGFIDSLAMLPASYSLLGRKRFLKILEAVSACREELDESIKHHLKTKPAEYVWEDLSCL